MQKRGQISVEFIMLFGMMFFVFILVLGAVIYYSQIKMRESSYIALEDLAYKIKGEVELASEVNDGYQRTFTIPSEINFKEYNLSVTNFELTIKLDEFEFSLFLPEYNGNLQKGANIIKKQGGDVYINT